MNKKDTLVEVIKRRGNLYDVNIQEAWRKLATRQFANEPGRGFEELISNAVDSYPDNTPKEKIKIDVNFENKSASITDWGEGMPLNRIDYLLTIGASDKSYNDCKIGQFGIGFCSLFNPVLHTNKVRVTTKCEGYAVELLFIVEKQGAPPRIESNILNKNIPYSTRIEAFFDSPESPILCRKWIEKKASFYPYNFVMNKEKFKTIWDKCPDSYHFETEYIRGRIYLSNHSYPWIRVLSKYCYILSTSMAHVICGRSEPYYDLRDYKEFPYIPRIGIDINCDNLNVVMSRNSFYMDHAYSKMRQELALVLKGYLLNRFNLFPDSIYNRKEIVLTNLFIFREKIAGLVESVRSKRYTSDPACFEHLLFEEKIFTIDGIKGEFSIKDLAEKKKSKLPIFFSRESYSINWLNKQYKHDFIIKLPPYKPYNCPKKFYTRLFSSIFNCLAVNLDTIHNDRDMIRRLVDDGIIDPDELVKKININQKKQLDEDQMDLISEISEWICDPAIKKALNENLKFRIKRIEIGLFEADGKEKNVLAALFDHNGNLLTKTPKEIHKMKPMPFVYIGLNASSPLFNRIKKSKKANRSYYLLGILIHELLHTQKIIPHSSKFFYLQGKIEKELIEVLQNRLLKGYNPK